MSQETMQQQEITEYSRKSCPIHSQNMTSSLDCKLPVSISHETRRELNFCDHKLLNRSGRTSFFFRDVLSIICYEKKSEKKHVCIFSFLKIWTFSRGEHQDTSPINQGKHYWNSLLISYLYLGSVLCRPFVFYWFCPWAAFFTANMDKI